MDCFMRLRTFIYRQLFNTSMQGTGVTPDSGQLTSDTDVDQVDSAKPEQDRGKLQFSLSFNKEKNKLTVGVLRASKLTPMDVGGTSDPFVDVYVLPNRKGKQQSKLVKSNLNPVFNDSFDFPITLNDLSYRTVVFEVFDYDRFSGNDLIGQVQFPLSNAPELKDGKSHTSWQKLVFPDDFQRIGDICFSLTYSTRDSLLSVRVIEAKNLRNMDLDSCSSDPYVTIAIYLGKKKLKKKRTEVKQGDSNPYYNKTFTFSVDNQQIRKIRLVLTVKDKDTFRDDKIGHIVLGSTTTGSSQRHFFDMLQNPRQPITRWHQLVEFKKSNIYS